MNLGRTLLSTLTRKRLFSLVQPRLLNQRQNLALALMACKFSSCNITKNIEFVTPDTHVSISGNVIQNFHEKKERPLLIMLCWLLSKRKHVMKFANLYMDQGFDVAMVSVTPRQLLFPVNGSRVVAADILNFLLENKGYKQVLLHGFSVGGYLWGEVLALIVDDHEKYKEIIDKIIGQIWDSVADIREFPIGTPRAIFPKNVMLQTLLQKYLEYHLKTFYNQTTQYYIRSSQLFHESIIHAPALLFVSKTDPVGTVSSNMKLRDNWEALGIPTCMKIFEKSPHVGHFRKYPKEYLAELHDFLSKLKLIQNEGKMRARL